MQKLDKTNSILLTTIQYSINVKSISENKFWAASTILELSPILTDIGS